MYQKKSTKGIKRAPYRKIDAGFDRYVAEVFGNRMNELGVTQTYLCEENRGKITQPTLSRVLRGRGGTNINTLAVVADILGMEIIIKAKNIEQNEA